MLSSFDRINPEEYIAGPTIHGFGV